MTRSRKKPRWVIVLTDNLACIDENKVFDPESEPKKNLLDELQSHPADEVLIALRKSFSVTYPRNPFVEGLQQALSEIRRIGVEALKEIPEVLQELGLPPVPATLADASSRRGIVFLFSLVRSADLSIKVQYQGKTHSLLKLLDPFPADPLIRTLRAVVSDTFSEMHNEEQCGETLKRIRDRIWDRLPPFNALLEEIEIEPIAERLHRDTAESSSGDEVSSADDHATGHQKDNADEADGSGS